MFLAASRWFSIPILVRGKFVRSLATQPQLECDPYSETLRTVTIPMAAWIGLDRVIRAEWDVTLRSVVEFLKYGYGQAGNRLWRHEVLATGNDELYSYDGLQRLVDMSRGSLAEGQCIDHEHVAGPAVESRRDAANGQISSIPTRPLRPTT